MVLPDMICENCQDCQDRDICRDARLNDFDVDESGLADWTCINCDA